MQTTVVSKVGKGSNPKTTLYVGGLESTVNEAALHSAFIPFGEVKEVSLPLDHATGTHRGFGFVEFEAPEDAAAAMDNMHNSGAGMLRCSAGQRQGRSHARGAAARHRLPLVRFHPVGFILCNRCAPLPPLKSCTAACFG